MSFLVMRPFQPEPASWLRSTFCCRAMRRTSGEAKTRASPAAEFVAEFEAATAGAVAATGGGGGAGAGAGFAFDAAGTGAGAAAPPDSSMMATTVWIGTYEPSGIRIFWSTPATEDWISVSILSVEISKSGSSRLTTSPSFLSHLVIVPSKMDSPIWGIGILVAI